MAASASEAPPTSPSTPDSLVALSWISARLAEEHQPGGEPSQLYTGGYSQGVRVLEGRDPLIL